MRLVILESPYDGPSEAAVVANVAYARCALRDSLLRGEAPIASHLLYTQEGVLDDRAPDERQLGIDAGLAWRTVASGSVVYVDRGLTPGMEYGITAARQAGRRVVFRRLYVHGAQGLRQLDCGLDVEEGIARAWAEANSGWHGGLPA